MSNTVATLRHLVGFPSLSRRPNEPIVAWAADYLRGTSARIRIIPGDEPDRISLLASYGPQTPDGIVLSAHCDVVPVEGQPWTSDPFTLREENGRLHARGATDMKGFLAAMLTVGEAAGRRKLDRPLHLMLSHDEEIGCVGIRSLLRVLAVEGFRAAGCIVGEPTGMRVATGHKGKIAAEAICRGEAAHSANPFLGCNAIGLAAGLVTEIEALQLWLSSQGTRDELYEVPFSTIQVGTIQGGTALNIVPDLCTLAFELRLLPGENGAALLDRLRDAAEQRLRSPRAGGHAAAIEISVTNAYPGLAEPDPDAEILALAKAASGSASEIRLGFGTEAGLISEQLEIPTVVCGPGSIDRAHKADEFITRAELDACDRFLGTVLDRLTA
jgi:acetylornithine deacetylase